MNTPLEHPLTQTWLERIRDGKTLHISDLMPYSKVRLRKRRMKKKFQKSFLRYISTNTQQAWIGCMVATPLTKSFQQLMTFDLAPMPVEDGPFPKGIIVYP